MLEPANMVRLWSNIAIAVINSAGRKGNIGLSVATYMSTNVLSAVKVSRQF